MFLDTKEPFFYILPINTEHGITRTRRNIVVDFIFRLFVFFMQVSTNTRILYCNSARGHHYSERERKRLKVLTINFFYHLPRVSQRVFKSITYSYQHHAHVMLSIRYRISNKYQTHYDAFQSPKRYSSHCSKIRNIKTKRKISINCLAIFLNCPLLNLKHKIKNQ